MQDRPSVPSIPQDTRLFEIVFQRISKTRRGSISFPEYLELALYHPEFGYYSDPERRAVGSEGDFFTSVSVGETFGFLLAHRAIAEWRERFHGTEPLVIVEQGAHDGRLARDILSGIAEIDPEAAEKTEYRILEPRPPVAKALAHLTAETAGAIRVVASREEASAESGIFLCNELLDAFPFHCLIREEGRWKERRVGIDEAGCGLAWVTDELPENLAAFASGLGQGYADGYSTEVCLLVDEWIADTSRLFDRGLWWIIDYGYEAEDYYFPHRSRGTLRCYRGHRASEDPFSFPGETDITAHVDFTRLGEAATRSGLSLEQFTDQHHFLIEVARPWLLSLEGGAPDARNTKRLRQFQTLTHPSLMGQQFKVMELSKGFSQSEPGSRE